MPSDDKKVAEDYRRQRQMADARTNGFENIGVQNYWRWIGENTDRLRDLARSNGVEEVEVDAALTEYLDKLRAIAPESSPLDDLNAQQILNQAGNLIETYCQKTGKPLEGGVALGTTPEYGAIASQRPVLGTGASIITVSSPFLSFCNAISKAMARTLIVDDARRKVFNAPTVVEAELTSNPKTAAEWHGIVRWMVCEGWSSPQMPAPQGTARLFLRMQLLQAIENFVLGHEYGHHVLRHGMTDSSVDQGDPLEDEYDADSFARAVGVDVAYQGELPNIYMAFGAGAVIILGILDLVRRAEAVLRTGSDAPPPPRIRHPPYEERLAALAEGDILLQELDRYGAIQMRMDFQSIIESIWRAILPELLADHQAGARPRSALDDGSGWLP